MLLLNSRIDYVRYTGHCCIQLKAFGREGFVVSEVLEGGCGSGPHCGHWETQATVQQRGQLQNCNAAADRMWVGVHTREKITDKQRSQLIVDSIESDLYNWHVYWLRDNSYVMLHSARMMAVYNYKNAVMLKMVMDKLSIGQHVNEYK